jgi:chorismate mutase / prephenate dehydratase
MSLPEIRERIDAVDLEIFELIERRAELVREVAREKKDTGTLTHDPEREREILARFEARAENAGLPRASIREIYREIMSACLSIEQSHSVAYMGPPGTFSHIAARNAFGLAARYLDFPTIGSVIDQVARGNVTYGVVPIENSTEGGVTTTLDTLVEAEVMIRAELVIEVAVCLIGREQDLSKIRRVHSHPQPLAQCRLFLARTLPNAEIVSSASTTAAIHEAALDDTAAALGSRLAAELYGLPVLREGVQDRAENATRFVILAKNDAPRSGNDKTSIVFSTPHAQGALRRALQIFDEEGLNLTRIESRPALGQRWEYVFFTDLIGHRSDEPVARAIERLKQSCATVRLLGSYARADTP